MHSRETQDLYPAPTGPLGDTLVLSVQTPVQSTPGQIPHQGLLSEVAPDTTNTKDATATELPRCLPSYRVHLPEEPAHAVQVDIPDAVAHTVALHPVGPLHLSSKDVLSRCRLPETDEGLAQARPAV